MVGDQSTILLVTVIGFASLVGVQVHAMWRDARARRWDLEDRAQARREHEAQQRWAQQGQGAPPPPPPAPRPRRGMFLRGPRGG